MVSGEWWVVIIIATLKSHPFFQNKWWSALINPEGRGTPRPIKRIKTRNF
jgi:hypothetical protein